LFADPAPTEDVFALAHSLVSTWEASHLDEEPETFPKKLKPRSIGAWFRLPGLHHTLEHYSRVWSGEEYLNDPWLEGDAAIERMISVVPGPPPPAAPEGAEYGARTTTRSAKKTKPAKTAAARKRRFKRDGKATVCVDLDGVLHRHDTRTLSEWADITILTARLSRAKAAERKKLVAALKVWLDEHGFAYAKIHNAHGKPPAQAYIDDRGVTCRPEDDGVKAFAAALKAAEEIAG